MTVHDKIAAAMKPLVGKTLNASEVRTLVIRGYPDTNPTSVIPGDHSGPNPKSGRSYCHCSSAPSQIFAREKNGYRVLDRAGTPEYRSIPPGKCGERSDDTRTITIDDSFIREWEPKYDLTEGDEPEYQSLVAIVARELATTGTISKSTFLQIWKWKGAMRVIRHVRIDEYEMVYAPAFRRAASQPSPQKLAALIEQDNKLPGVDGPTGSTIIHFMHPHSMPIIDVRTVEVLFAARLISTSRKDLAHYEEFRTAVGRVRTRCPGWSLRQIDRALFAYHKQFLEKTTRLA